MVALGGGAVYVGVTQGFDKGFLNYFTLGVAAIPLIGPTVAPSTTAIGASLAPCINTIGSFVANSPFLTQTATDIGILATGAFSYLAMEDKVKFRNI